MEFLELGAKASEITSQVGDTMSIRGRQEVISINALEGSRTKDLLTILFIPVSVVRLFSTRVGEHQGGTVRILLGRSLGGRSRC